MIRAPSAPRQSQPAAAAEINPLSNVNRAILTDRSISAQTGGP
jgi:hypothetical protein